MELLVFIGIPGAGKSTFYKARFFDTHLRVNLDQLRTRARETALLRTCFDAKIRCVWDGTNLSRPVRAPAIIAARGAGFRVHAFYFEPQFRSSIARNARRSGAARVPLAAIGGAAKRLQAPDWSEGFASIFSVWNDEDSFRVREWPHEI